MPVSTPTAPDSRSAAASSLSQHAQSFLALLARFGRNVMAKAKSGLRTLQMARMLSTLSSMSDHQLAQIGITRSDIRNYAETLMADE